VRANRAACRRRIQFQFTAEAETDGQEAACTALLNQDRAVSAAGRRRRHPSIDRALVVGHKER
jgi:hypothetical protein